MSGLSRPCGEHCNRSTCAPTICHGRVPYEELPCREFCQSYSRGCAKGRCRNPYPKDDPRHWLGRGSEPVAGKPFGWAHMMQDIAIADWQRSRGIDPKSAEAFFQRSRMKMRLERDYHRRKPPVGVRRISVAPVPMQFTRDELLRIADHFDGANDPEGQAIAAKARALAG